MALFRHVISGTFPGEEWSVTLHTEGTLSVGDAEAANAAAITAAYAFFVAKRAEYRECVAISRSAEGLSLSMSADVAAKQLIEEHQAYRRLLDASTAAEGTPSQLLAGPRGFTVDFSRLTLHSL